MTEEATGTTLEMDGNCISNVKAADGSDKLTELGRRLAVMAEAPDEEWYVDLTPAIFGVRAAGGEAWASGTKWGQVWLGTGDHHFFSGPWGQCDGGTAKMGMPGMLAHELLGHLWRARGGGSLKDDAAEDYSTISENFYRAMPGKGPERCRYN